MGRWTDIAVWGGQAADNFGDGDWASSEASDRMLEYRGVVIHIAEGSEAGTISWERNPSSDISSHFVVGLGGQITQMVDTGDYSWCQSAGNRSWLSVENAGHSGTPLTLAQVEANARILAKAHQVYGVPLQATDSTAGRGLGWHGMGGANWGSHYSCPGEPIRAQFPAIVARAQQIVMGDDDMPLSDADVRRIVQDLTNAIGRGTWELGYVDATFDPNFRSTPQSPLLNLATVAGKVDALAGEVKRLQAPQVDDAQVAALAERIGATLAPAMAAAAEAAVRKVLGEADNR